MNRNKRVERAMEETMDVTKRRHLSVVGGINTNYKTKLVKFNKAFMSSCSLYCFK